MGAGAAAGQLEAKVVILGMQGVGKTSIVHRYTSGQFSLSLTSTIGASFCIKKLSVDGCKVRLQIWDTAGQERFRSMAPMYYRGANAAIIVYDITNEDSFLDVENWINELREMSTDLVIQVVGSKADLAPTHRAVDLDSAQRMVQNWTDPTHHHHGNGNASYLDDPLSSANDSGIGGSGINGSSTTPGGAGGSGRDEGGGGGGKAISFGGLGFGRGRKSGEMERSRSREAKERLAAAAEEEAERMGMGRWGSVGVTEVSAKDDFGIEDLFLLLTRRLVARKAEIDHQRWARSRDSIVVGDPSTEGDGVERPAGWCCA